jgi:ATP-binding cassette, subfamily B, bacterial PglK
MNTLKKAIGLLTPHERSRGLLILFLAMGMAVLEALGVVSVMPFLAVLANPNIVQSNSFLKELFDYSKYLGIKSPDDFLVLLGVVVIVLIVVSAIYRTATIYIMNRFIEMRRHTISTCLLETYLGHSYPFFLDRHSSDMSKTILSEVDQLISNVIRPTFNMLANGLVIISITMLLVLVNPWLALIAAGFLAGLYSVMFYIFKSRLTVLGGRLVNANKERFMAASEALGAIKEIKLLGCEDVYIGRFIEPSKKFAKTIAGHQTINQVPKYAVEVVAFGGLIAIILYLMTASGGLANNSFGEILPIIGLYAYSAYRLQPALQAIFSGFVGLRYSKVVVDNLYFEINPKKFKKNKFQVMTNSLVARQAIELKNISYSYPGSGKSSLVNLNLIIPVGSSIGVIGCSGSGKTTLVDVILGLLRPTSGHIAIDGKPLLDSQVRLWQSSLGYVPQEIFLTDSTIAENIALGVPRDQIDLTHVVLCAQMAQIHDLIVNELPLKYETKVGERGVRLSGGQRQRIGIARALYRNPEVLVFDEATSALDTITEDSVINAINSLAKNKTIITIAHRLSTIKNCDQIFILDQGEESFSGTYTEFQQKTD